MSKVSKLPTRIVEMHSAQQLPDNVLVSIETIDPETAAKWLKCNTRNRPVRRGHVNFIAREISSGLWQLNGQTIVVSDTEDVLDGQHRLHAVIVPWWYTASPRRRSGRWIPGQCARARMPWPFTFTSTSRDS